MPRRTDLPLKSLFDTLDTCPEAIDSIKLTGGEPSFHPEISALIDGLSERDVFIELYSNGALTRLSDRAMDKVGKFNLSFDSVDAELNACVRGDLHANSAFHTAMHRLRELNKDVIEVQITLSQPVLPTLEKTLVYLVEKMGVDRIKLSDIVEEMPGQYGDLRLHQDQLGDVLVMVDDARERYHFTKILRTTFFDRKEYLSLHRNIRHLRAAFLNQNSDLYFFIGENAQFQIGNIITDQEDRIKSQFEVTNARATRMMDHAYHEIRQSDLRYITPTEFLYSKAALGRFVPAS